MKGHTVHTVGHWRLGAAAFKGVPGPRPCLGHPAAPQNASTTPCSSHIPCGTWCAHLCGWAPWWRRCRRHSCVGGTLGSYRAACTPVLMGFLVETKPYAMPTRTRSPFHKRRPPTGLRTCRAHRMHMRCLHAQRPCTNPGSICAMVLPGRR